MPGHTNQRAHDYLIRLLTARSKAGGSDLVCRPQLVSFTLNRKKKEK